MIAAADDNAEAGHSSKRRKGYVLLYRSLLDSPIFDDAGQFRLFVYLLLRAAHKRREVRMRIGRGSKTVVVEAGQLVFGCRSAAEKLRDTKTSVSRRINALKAGHHITVEPGRHYSIVSICNWSSYQNAKPKLGTPNGENLGHQPPKSGTPSGTPIGTIQGISNKSLSEERETAPAEAKPTKPKPARLVIPPTLEMVSAYCAEKCNGIDPEKFIDHYTATGWMKGKAKVIDWQATIRTWARNDFNKGSSNGSQRNQPSEHSATRPRSGRYSDPAKYRTAAAANLSREPAAAEAHRPLAVGGAT